MTLFLEIVTPVKIVYKNEVNQLTVPTVNGEITILPNHSPLLTKIAPGEARIKKGNTEELLAITGGFLELNNNKITILADHAVRADDIEVAKAEEAKKRAEKLMQEKLNEKDFAIAESELRKSILELKVARRKRRT